MDGEMQLSPTGILVEKYWHEIPQHFPYVELGSFVVMPNHVHGIIIINGKPNDHFIDNTETNDDNIIGMDGTVETRHALYLHQPQKRTPPSIEIPSSQMQSSLQPQPPQILPPPPTPSGKTIGQKRFQHQGENTISSMVGSFKSAVTKNAHQSGIDFEWQPGFYDHVIRDDGSYQRIRNYIINNPKNWNNDKFNK
jgi:REP element-mobilizing transposase RayT